MSLTHKQLNFLEKALAEYYKENFYAFVKDWFESWRGVAFKSHYTAQYVCEHIQLATEGNIERLIISLPRGWGKSIIVSEATPVYALLNDPQERIGCYSRALTEDAKMWHENSIRILNAERTLKYFPEDRYRLTSQSKIILRTKAGGYRKVGSCLSSSVGSDMTLAIIDDPADQEHFRSEAKRSRLENFFTKSLLRAVRTVDYEESEDYLSQLTPKQQTEYELTKYLEDEAKKQNLTSKKPRIILTMQRLHTEDPVAMFLNINEAMENAGLKTSFKYIKIPALHEERTSYFFPITKQEYIAEEGEYTLAGTLTKEGIEKAKIEMLEEDFQAQMQQNPIIGSNQIIKASYFCYYTEEMLQNTHFAKIFITVDTATKTKEANDFSVICCWGATKEHLYLLDMIRGKWEFAELGNNFLNFYNKWQKGLKKGGVGCNKIIVEDASAGTQLIQSYQKLFPSYLLKPLKRVNDKFTRYTSIGRYIELGNVYLPSSDVVINGVLNVKQSITDVFIKECTTFTADNSHKHDDIVDNLIDACVETFLEKENWFSSFANNG